MQFLGPITNQPVVSRDADRLAVSRECVIDSSIHSVVGEIVKKGKLLAKNISTGKYRAYAEGTLTGGGTSTSSAAFSVDPTGSAAGDIRVGDVLYKADGTTLVGTVATYNPATGSGTFAANAAVAVAAGQILMLGTATYSVAYGSGRILNDDVQVEGADAPASAWVEGFFLQAQTSVTAAALSAIGGVAMGNGEIRIR